MRRTLRIILLLALPFGILPAFAAPAAAEPEKAEPPATASSGQWASTASTASAAGMSAADLDKMLAPLVGDGDATARRATIKATLDLGTDAIPAIAKELKELAKNQSGAVFAALKLAREQRRGQPDMEMVDALLDMKKNDGPGAKTALTTLVLLKALAHMGTTPAVRVILTTSDDHAGALRQEIAKILHDVGDRALPALIEAKKDPSSEVRKFAHTQIEAMGKKTAGDAVQTKSNQVLADVLRAFANTHEIDAVPVILSFVNSDRAEVQGAAREAILRFGNDAVWKVREAYTNLTGKSPPESARSDEVAKELFAAYDRVRLKEVYDLLEQGKKSEQDGKLDDAVAQYDKVLARQPLLDRRAEMVPAFVSFAKAQADAGKADVAKATLRKALRLDPEGPHAAQIRAELLTMEGKELEARGIAEKDLFTRALAEDPANVGARAELDRLEAGSEDRHQKLQRYAAAGAVFAIAVAFIVLFGGRRKAGKTTKPRARAA